MRIPTSVIVMSLLTAAPFGMAIRDTLNKKPVVSEALESYGDESYSRRRIAEYEAEAAREATLEAVDKERAARERLARLNSLFGAEKASLGSFLGVQLSAPNNDALETKLRDLEADDFVTVSPVLVNEALASVRVYINDGRDSTTSSCEELRSKLTAAWGPSVNGTWINSATHQRATLKDDRGECELVFETYLEPAEWVTLLPIALIGKPSAKLEEKAGPDREIYDDEIEYSFAGVGYGTSSTRILGTIDNGKVASVLAFSETDFDTLVSVRDAISALRKEQPKLDDASGAWVWKKKPVLSLLQDSDSNKFELRIGKDPYQ